MDVGSNKSKFRGKLYTLSDASAWEDTGTGHVSVTGTAEDRRLIFRDEESGQVLHDRPVFPAGTYQLQGEGEKQTIIVWEDPESQKDWALSFQDSAGTAEIWEALTRDDRAAGKRLLPLPKLGNLAELSRMLVCVPPNQREALAADCASARFLNGLRDAFHTAEDLGSEEELSCLWRIAKGAFLLSSQKLTERYLRQDVYEDILGMLEYDEGLPADKRIAHRQVFRSQIHFNQVLAFEDAELLERIHLNYRLQYLKDIVLPRLLDDAAFVSMTQMIHNNLSIILGYLQRNPHMIERLFAQIRQKDLQSMLFLQDVCRLSKQVAPAQRQELFEKMVEKRLFETLAPFLSEPYSEDELKVQQHPRHVAVEVLLLSALNATMHLRRFLVSETAGTGRVLLLALVRLMLTESDQGVQGQTAEVLQSVMDPSSLENHERERCLDVLYEGGVMDELVSPLRGEAVRPETPQSCFALQLVCDLLAFAVLQHGYHAKVYVIRNGLVQHAARLLVASRRFLQLAPVRLLRAVVSTKDDAYHRYLAKTGAFGPLMRSFHQSAQPPALGSNLLVSATLELVEFIRIENIKVLVDHLCKKHGNIIEELAPKYKPLEALLLKQQQNQEYEKFPPDKHAAGGPIVRGSGVGRSGRTRSPARDDSDDDEAYFESLDEDEPAAGDGAQCSAVDSADSGGEVSRPLSDEATQSGSALKSLLGNYDEEDEDAAAGCAAVAVASAAPGAAVGVPASPAELAEPSDPAKAVAPAEPAAAPTAPPATGEVPTPPGEAPAEPLPVEPATEAAGQLGANEALASISGSADTAVEAADQGSVVSMKRSGDAEDVVPGHPGNPESADASNAEQEGATESEAKDMVDEKGSEKVLNHVSKKLKMSDSGSP